MATKVKTRSDLPAMPAVEVYYIEDEKVIVRQIVVREEMTAADMASAKATALSQIATSQNKLTAEIEKQQKIVDAMDDVSAELVALKDIA